MHYTLREHQEKSVEYAVAHPYCILALEMGTGKSLCALTVAHRTNSKLLVVCPSYLLFNWELEIKKFYPDKVISSFYKYKDVYNPWDTDICIASYDIAGKSDILFEWADIVAIDECFHEDTEVETHTGIKRIKDIKVGDYVRNHTGFCKVKSVSKKIVTETVDVRYNGKTIRCSTGHPFFTERGWVMAKNLKKGDRLYAVNNELRERRLKELESEQVESERVYCMRESSSGEGEQVLFTKMPLSHKTYKGKRGREGRKEGENTKFYGVESVEVLQQTGIEGEGGSTFYDLGVCFHPSFTVNGALVHNCHYVKNMKAKRSDNIHRLVYENNISRVMLMTGTPIENRVWELYSLIAICNYNPQLKESSFLTRFPTYEHFADYFSYREERTISTARGRRKVLTWNGRKNIKELKEVYLKDIFIRYRAEDCLDLPESVYYDIDIGDVGEEGLLDSFKEYNSENREVGPSIKSQVALKKAPFTIKYVKELREQGVEKIIIYTDHVESCEEIAKAFKVTPIHGKISVDRRRLVAQNFINGNTPVLVATIGSFSTGVNLTAARDMVFNDFPWVPGRLDQAEARIRRMGQKFICRFHRILGSIQDKYILDIISGKKETIDEVVDGIERNGD
jgi:superfamily II DNA or RNA helicase